MTTSSKNHRSQVNSFLDVLRCPHSGERLIVKGDALVTEEGRQRYRLSATGIVLFAENPASPDAQAQRQHYNKIAAAYTANLGYPHTREYLAYLDRAVLEAAGEGELGTVAELCCGRGEALTLIGSRVGRYIGIDISETMLEATLNQHNHPRAILLQADATLAPLAPESVDTVIMLGGIHHVLQRERLFLEVARILKPGGRFIFREPVSDFWLWRALRAVIYKVSPMLNHDTERPLRYHETVPVMERAGLRPIQYRSHRTPGFLLIHEQRCAVF